MLLLLIYVIAKRFSPQKWGLLAIVKRFYTRWFIRNGLYFVRCQPGFNMTPCSDAERCNCLGRRVILVFAISEIRLDLNKCLFRQPVIRKFKWIILPVLLRFNGFVANINRMVTLICHANARERYGDHQKRLKNSLWRTFFIFNRSVTNAGV